MNQKRWDLVFTSLVSLSVHQEAIEDLFTSYLSMPYAGSWLLENPVLQLRSNRGTNFIEAVNELNISSDLVEDPV